MPRAQSLRLAAHNHAIRHQRDHRWDEPVTTLVAQHFGLLANDLERSERMAIASAPALACSVSTLSMLVASISASRASIASINSSGSRTVSSLETAASMPLRLSR